MPFGTPFRVFACGKILLAIFLIVYQFQSRVRESKVKKKGYFGNYCIYCSRGKLLVTTNDLTPHTKIWLWYYFNHSVSIQIAQIMKYTIITDIVSHKKYLDLVSICDDYRLDWSEKTENYLSQNLSRWHKKAWLDEVFMM